MLNEGQRKRADAVLALLEEGKSLNAAGKEAGVPEGTFREWLDRDAALAAKYTRAREIGYKRHADAIIEIADQAEDPNKARVQIDARKWILAKMLPKVYGERIEHDHKGGITVTLSSAEDKL